MRPAMRDTPQPPRAGCPSWIPLILRHAGLISGVCQVVTAKRSRRPATLDPVRAGESALDAASGDHAIIGYHLEAGMTDVLIRDVPDDVIAALDAHAGRLGLSRSEYVRRRLAQDAAAPGSPVSAEDLARFADTFADLADPDVMSQAWK